ncbi:L-glutamate gamma-semialdehyde dehydrogenase [Planctomyces sp. SH-PL14]|uniref:L-glutamate gamma-semialdehyde dehydrogenase n=1 Tax=Planctomyces sp. SH-PL14 TaxID=1632864 RepID=UPI00078E0FCD|nr:L-glutamate gamma-semialdehyde dehydrogenase [Planctomyces sp. SH-PL14]AMV21377.1 1-pyrroline-5-carboxylate dehydrogenase 1 [Planctomyces sp. SH-PL14]
MAKKKATAVSSTSSPTTSVDDVTERNEELGMEAGAADASDTVVSPIAGKPAPPEWVVTGYPFQNEPPTDFSRDDMREAMEQALADVADQLGGEYGLVINGKTIDTRAKLTSKNPAHRKQVVGTLAAAHPDHVPQAVDAARRAYRGWSRTPAQQRAEYLEVIAAEMRNRRFELAAWEIYECGKTWAEADADVAEAIDFCMYYAAQMRDLSVTVQCDFPGEENSYTYRPRGVVGVIAPWNFPLAILTGMTVAALVAGNTVVMKPAEQSSVVAAKLMEMFRDAGLPNGVVNFLPGIGEELGPALVAHTDVDMIVFTGSRAVGLAINKDAADTDPRQSMVKRVVAEMGGKNAIIIDDDADLDEAVLGVLQSAFGYSGQKCSACSRVIVLGAVYDAFLARLKPAVESLRIGPPEEPATSIGPVIDEEAQKRIQDYIAVGMEEHRVIVAMGADGLTKEGYYVGPHVFADVEPTARIAQDEIFGPVLAVIRAKNLDEAIDFANRTPYALTAGIYSRSPRNLQRVKQELQVGNLYINRGITGALVQRHPFGGYKMSGIGSKAGGRDYLLQFLIPVCVSENTMRRGFAPDVDATA